MSVKRQATTDLNHENWDQEDPSDHEEMGSFKSAPKDVLEKRVIRTAKRRSVAPGDETKKGVFSGFGGFNKTPASSFDFLANLTNGSKTNGSPASKSDTAVTSSFFGSKTSSSSGMFNMPMSSSSPVTKSKFGMPTQTSSSLFGGSSSSSATVSQSPFTASKADSTVADSPFKNKGPSSSADTSQTEASPKCTTENPNALSSQVTSTIFGSPSTNANNKSLFSATTSNTAQPSFGMTSKSSVNETENKTGEKSDDKKLNYYSKLKGLNESVSDWIKKHVEDTPLCILTPIFKDYEKYLKEIQDEYHGKEMEMSNKASESTITESKTSPRKLTKSTTGFSDNLSGSSLFSGTSNSNSKTSLFGSTNNAAPTEKTSGFSFGTNKPATVPSNDSTATSGGFSFGINTSTPATIAPTTSSPFSLATNTTTNANGSAPFSFGIGKPFSFSPNVQKPVEQTNDTKCNEEEDEPPKVEFTPVVEENSVFDKRCKIFVKKDGNFVDKGVGTLYIKKIEESGKHQLLVRANTNLGNVLLNLIASSSIPIQRLGKNNVMMICIPTPDAQPPPTPILIRVKTSEEADDLLKTLEKYAA